MAQVRVQPAVVVRASVRVLDNQDLAGVETVVQARVQPESVRVAWEREPPGAETVAVWIRPQPAVAVQAPVWVKAVVKVMGELNCQNWLLPSLT